MRQRHQRTRDVFDTGPFGAYRDFGAEQDKPSDNSSTTNPVAGMVSYNGFYYTYAVSTWSVYDSEGTLLETGGGPNTTRNRQKAMQWIDSGEAPTYPNKEFNEIENYEQAMQEKADAYNPQIPNVDYEGGEYFLPNVGQAIAAGQPVATNSARKYWDGNLSTHNWETHGFSTPQASGVKDGGIYPRPIVDSFGGYAMSLSHYIASYNAEGAFLGFRVLTASELAGGIPAGIPMATVIQMFTKCAKVRERKLLGGLGIENDFANNGRNFVLDTEVEPIWRKALDMPMNPKSFFFVEEALATGNKINVPDGGYDNQIVVQGTHLFDKGDFESTYTKGYKDVPSVFSTTSFPDRKPRAKTLDREFRQALKVGNFESIIAPEKSKVNYAVKMEWLGEDGQFSSFSTHPPSMPDCDPDQGKTMVVYRFPRQLDEELDKELLAYYAENNMPDYSITNTGECYPMPNISKANNPLTTGDGKILKNKDKYGLIGRLAPTSSDELDSEMYEAEYGGKTYAGRRKINLVPMISPNLPPSNRHRPYLISQSQSWFDQILNNPLVAGVFSNDPDLFKAADWFCFDTTTRTGMTGAAVSVTDPYKKAYLGSGRLTNAYFPKGNLDVGSTAFAIGHCMLTYDMASPSVDAKLGENEPVINLPHASERIIITTETKKMDSASMPFRSFELNPEGRPNDGSAAGNYTSDYLPPLRTITTDDLVNIEKGLIQEPVGMEAIRDAWRKTMGNELSVATFAALPNVGANDNPGTDGKRDPNNPLRYTINTDYGTFSYPFTIAIFSVPQHHMGPVLKYSTEVDVNDNYKPVGPTADKPGYIGTRDIRLVYQTPFGEVNSSVISLDKQIQRQLDTVQLDEYGNPVVTDGTTDVSNEGGLFDQQTQEGGIDEGQYTEDEQEIFTERTFKNWMYNELMNKYGNVRYTDTTPKAYFKWWNKDYVTGKMLLEAGYPIPGVDYEAYRQEAARQGITMVTQQTDAESQDAQTANTMLGLGAFSDASGFTITDVTAKWGAIGSASPRYTGDVGMSMVPYDADVVGEERGYMAMTNLDGVDNLGNSLLDKAVGTDAITEGVGKGAKYLGILGGSGLAIAGIGLAGSAIMFASISSVQAIKIRKATEIGLKKATDLIPSKS